MYVLWVLSALGYIAYRVRKKPIQIFDLLIQISNDTTDTTVHGERSQHNTFKFLVSAYFAGCSHIGISILHTQEVPNHFSQVSVVENGRLNNKKYQDHMICTTQAFQILEGELNLLHNYFNQVVMPWPLRTRYFTEYFEIHLTLMIILLIPTNCSTLLIFRS